MDLTTRCPQCGTTFSAPLSQLQLRKGYVRCVNCSYIFDGYEAVVPADETAAGAASTPAATTTSPAQPAAPPVPAVPTSRTEPTVSLPAEVAPTPVASTLAAPNPAAPAMPSVVRHRQPPTRSAEKPAPTFVIPRAPAAAPAGRQDPVFKIPESSQTSPEPSRPGSIYVEPRRAAPRPREHEPDQIFAARAPGVHAAVKVFWSVLIAAGLLLLAAQLVYVYRAQIANSFPASRPMLERACVPLRCTIAYSRRIDLISITSSSLRASGAPNAASTESATAPMTLQLTMRNNHDKPQEWPTLVLDLTDFSGTLVARKNLGPGMYLPPELSRRPFEARSEVTVSLPLTLNDLKINGYQIDKFFP